jgi:hypothetical protein
LCFTYLTRSPTGTSKFAYLVIRCHSLFRDLHLLFRRFGTLLSAIVAVDWRTGRSKGFGFVDYSAQREAQAVVSEMDGFEVSVVGSFVCVDLYPLFFSLAESV